MAFGGLMRSSSATAGGLVTPVGTVGPRRDFALFFLYHSLWDRLTTLPHQSQYFLDETGRVLDRLPFLGHPYI
jgi:hypothetical protein